MTEAFVLYQYWAISSGFAGVLGRLAAVGESCWYVQGWVFSSRWLNAAMRAAMLAASVAAE